MRFTLNGEQVGEAKLPFMKTYTVMTLPVPRSAIDLATIDLGIETTTWNPRSIGIPDDRQLGIMMAWDRLLALSS